MARAHNQITDDHWGPAPVKNLLEAEAAAFLTTQKDRLLLDGPNVLLNPQAYSTLALVVHELVTNSVKYGSLSVESGEALVEWSVRENGDLHFCWRERGGPEVAGPPQRKGFGTTIIEHSVPYDLGGTAKVDYPREGVRADFVIPAKHVVQAGDIAGTRIYLPDAPHSPVEHASTLLRGKKVLLVEDSLIIALDAEDLLVRLGADSVATEGSAVGAIAAIETDRPDVAILDINLGDHDSVPIANRLAELGVPFIFATGYGEQSALPDHHKARPVAQKPYTLASLSRRLSELLGVSENA